MELRFTPEALAQLAARRTWWQANRADAVGAFDEELDEALAAISVRGVSLPVAVRRGGREVRRVLLPRVRCHVYFEVVESADTLVVVAAWGAQMRRLPPLAKVKA